MDSVRQASDAVGDIAVVPPDPCSPCRKRYGTRSRLADWYCIHCREFICGECKASHEAFSMFSQHKIITQTKGAEAADIFREMSEMETCSTHEGRMLEFFCPAHKSFCCSACIPQFHKKCEIILDVQDRNRTSILGTSTDVLQVFHSLTKQIQGVEKQHHANKRYLEKLENDLPELFTALKKKIINLLEKAKETVKGEINKMIKEEERGESILQSKAQDLNHNIEKSLTKLEVSLEHGSDTQKILTEHEMASKATQFQDEVKTMQISTTKPSIEICLQPSFIDLFQDPENIFKVSKHGTPTGPEARPSQVFALPARGPVVTYAKPFCDRSAKFVAEVKCKISDSETPLISGCDILSDGRLVIADYEGQRLKLYSKTLSFENEMLLDTKPWDVTAYDKEEIAVTFFDKILLVYVKKTMSTKQTLAVQYTCYGISSINSNRLIVAAGGVGVIILDLHGTEISRVRCDECIEYPHYLSLSGTKSVAYVSSFACNKVCAVDLSSNKVLFTYQHDQLKGPCGVAVDQDGNVYVCGCNSNNVHQISHDGQLIKILLPNDGVISKPQSICFTSDGNGLIIADSQNLNLSDRVRKFDMI